MAVQKQLSIIMILLLLSAFASANNYRNHPKALLFIDNMVATQGFDRAYLQQLMASAQRQDAILTAIARPAEKTKAWKDYRKLFLSKRRTDLGRQFMQTHAKALERAEQQYGVPAEVITAIIGVETYYGDNKGRHRVIDALCTLAFDYPPRSTFFSKELEQYLLLVDEMGFNPLQVKGSYAGAMGYGQFIPSSYRHYAVDFVGDGVADLINNPVDAIGSVANYLSVHGWRRGELIAVPVVVTDTHDATIADSRLKPQHTVAQLRLAGYMPSRLEDRNLDDSAMATIMALQGEQSIEHWMGLQNFYVITRYNHSRLYGMAVFELSKTFGYLED